MENFEYSIQLSDQDWAEFSATAEECGLLQAGLASGDELLSSDIDQGDSSGSSPPEHLPLLGRQLASRGRGWPGFEEEDKAATQQLVSRSWQEAVLALGAGQQMPSTSAPSEAQPSLSPGDTPPGQNPYLLGPVTSRDEMQRLLQGPAPRDPAPSVPGEPPRSPESPGRSTASQKPPGSPGAPPRSSPSRKKRRAAGTKGGGRPGVAGSAPTQLGSPRLSEARPKEGLGPAGSREKGLSAGTAEQTAGAGQDKLGPESAGAHEQVARQRPGLDLSTSEQGTDLRGMTPRAELHTVPIPTQESGPDSSMAKSDTALSPPAREPQADSALSTPARKPETDMALSTPALKPQADSALSTPASKPETDMALSTPACKPQADTVLSTPALKPQADLAMSTPACKPQADSALSTPAYNSRVDVNLPVLGPVVKPEVDSSIPVSKAQSEVDASTFALSPKAGPDMTETKFVPSAKLDLSSAVSSGGHLEKPRGQPSADDTENHSGEPPPVSVQAPKKKKVRFSVAVSSPEELGSGEASGPLSPATAWPSAPRTAVGGRGGPGAWDTVAVGPRPPQPRILKHLPPPPSAASGGPGYRSCFAVTVPEAYEFFFCDTIAEEDEEAEEAAEAGQVPADVQWPDVCEFFFRDCQAQTSGLRAHRFPAPPLKAKPVPGDPMPISIPEAYEHFLGEDRLGDMLGPASLQLQAAELPRPAPPGVESGTPPDTSQATAEQLDLVVRQAGEPRGPLTTFTFSQNDMCLVFVAFATWAVRTSDLHTPDAWKTVLLANIGTISAIRYFRRQVRRGRPGPSPSPSPSS